MISHGFTDGKNVMSQSNTSVRGGKEIISSPFLSTQQLHFDVSI